MTKINKTISKIMKNNQLMKIVLKTFNKLHKYSNNILKNYKNHQTFNKY